MPRLPDRRQLVRIVRKGRRSLFEALGSARFSKPALHGMDEKLQSYLPKEGFFVEAGANDGFHESNTYFLERVRGWTGLLVEPIPELYRDCRRQRLGSRVVQCALVADSFAADTVTLVYGNLISQVRDSLTEDALARLRWTAGRIHVSPYEVTVPARTLSSILDELGSPRVDFMSLDVEGYESDVLQGMDMDRHSPEILLVECLNEEALGAVSNVLEARYEMVEVLSPVDYLFRRR